MPAFLDTLTGYPAFFLMCALAGLLVPLPEDIPLIYGGMQIATGDMNFALAIPVGMAGVLLRDCLFFFTAWAIGESLLRNKWLVRFVGEDKLLKARKIVADHGGTAILIGRFSIGFRVSMFLVAGALGVRPRQFLFWDTVGLAIAVPVWLLLGRTVGQPVVDGVMWVNANARWGALIVVVVGVAGWLVWRRFRRPVVS